MKDMSEVYIVSEQEEDRFLDALHHLCGEKRAMRHSSSGHLVCLSQKYGMMSTPAKGANTDAFRLVLLLHVCQKPVQLKHLRALRVSRSPLLEALVLFLRSDWVSVKDVREKDKETLVSQLISK